MECKSECVKQVFKTPSQELEYAISCTYIP